MALLVALAVLAERVAARSLPVRCLVLCVLRRAEVAAAQFVFEARGAPLASMPILTSPNDPADAIRLAARFHALAAALGALLAVICRFNAPAARPGCASGHIWQCPGGPCVNFGGWIPMPNDTS
ncbi:hypothetical protein GRZ55_09930 [Chelativorans sp. ZYF759]|uniref:hypothetical protein n=1 Tax=Chelativorans sp. ZYF759 TaxID=2692213 RepID=UPI00145D5F85|nr:hypothetical protein [Chelativorans sp. ZYF759]NMG39559.1 hypothetical protein [Chelativorans sp. ZYF759]